MRTLKKSLILLLFLFLTGPAVKAGMEAFAPLVFKPISESVQSSGKRFSFAKEQKQYFLTLYQDTWNYLISFVEPLSGLPYDSSARQPVTSISNVGLYLSAVSIAYQTELISRQEAIQRIEECLAALNKIEKWRGFPRPWIFVRSLKPAYGEEFSYSPHLTLLVTGLSIAQTTFPELSKSISDLMLPMRFEQLYDMKNGWLKGGYNMRTQNFSVQQPWGHWYYKYFASDLHVLSLYMMSRGYVPQDHWGRLIRPVQVKEGRPFFASGSEEGGLAAQYLSGLFLDERSLSMGVSQKNYAGSQMDYAKRRNFPVWGWSTCESPDGRYLSQGELADEIVSPHASMMAAIYFPEEAIENLKKLESMGMRPQTRGGELDRGFGFLDSVDWKTGKVSEHYLMANQAMAFLSLANLIYDGIVWQSFERDPLIALQLQQIRPLELPAGVNIWEASRAEY